MKRKQAIGTLMVIGEIIAKEWNLTEIKTKELSCGIWDQFNMSNTLKMEYGEEMKTIIFHDGKYGYDGRKNLYVELTYRFGNPQINVFGRDSDGKQTLASLELSDYKKIDGRYAHTGDYKFSESQVWGMEGVAMLERLISMWMERNGE